MLRTYVKRKTKETAEEKFDLLFGKKSADKVNPTKAKDSKRRKIGGTEESCDSLPKSQHLNTASLKFDALYGQDRTKTSFPQPAKDDNITKISNELMPDAPSPSERSKYDILFERNEKLASDKFDAMFTESEHISQPRKHPASLTQKWKNTDQSKVLHDLSSFNSWKDEPSTKRSGSCPTSPLKQPKLPSITHASMVKLGGRVVLNIQRGGESKSLIKDGGTLLLSPEKKISNTTQHSKTEDNGDTVEKISSSPDANVEATQQVVTRKLLSSSKKKTNKSKVSYNSRPWAASATTQDHAFAEPKTSALSSSQKSSNTHVNEFSQDEETPALKRSTTWSRDSGENSVTSVKCPKNQRQYFTVVRHVKNYQNCLEDGEIQEFRDELQYLQEGLSSTQPVHTRCLSVTSLASKCEQQNFRLYLRAHNVLNGVFETLQDAAENEALGFATSCLLYMLSRDRQIDITRTMLRVLLKLADPLERNSFSTTTTVEKESEAPKKSKYSRLHRGRTKKADKGNQEVESVRSMIKDLIDRCGDPLVTSADLSTKVLASEALLRYTARRTSEWYREEIRLKGGLDHVINLVKHQVDIIEEIPQEVDFSQQSPSFKNPLCTVERLLRVLENGIVNSPRNAMYLVTHQRALLLKKISILMTKCGKWISQLVSAGLPKEDGSSMEKKNFNIVKNVIVQTLKLLINISNDNEWASTRIGDQEGLLQNTLFYVVHIPENMDENHRYEILLLSLGLLINLVESSAKNRIAIMQMRISPPHELQQNNSTTSTLVVEGLIKLFVDCEIAARENEILGEDGVKKAAQKKQERRSSLDGYNALPGSMANDDEGYWVESEEGMEWVSVKTNDDDDDLPSSQSSHHSRGDPKNIEAKLTPEQRKEMDEALEKANDHMEASIVASYVSLVLGCLIHGNRHNAQTIRSSLPNNGDFNPMITMLKKFLSFMKLTHAMSQKGEQKLMQVIEELEEINLNKIPSTLH